MQNCAGLSDSLYLIYNAISSEPVCLALYSATERHNIRHQKNLHGRVHVSPGGKVLQNFVKHKVGTQ